VRSFRPLHPASPVSGIAGQLRRDEPELGTLRGRDEWYLFPTTWEIRSQTKEKKAEVVGGREKRKSERPIQSKTAEHRLSHKPVNAGRRRGGKPRRRFTSVRK